MGQAAKWLGDTIGPPVIAATNVDSSLIIPAAILGNARLDGTLRKSRDETNACGPHGNDP